MFSLEKFLKDSYSIITGPQVLKNVQGGSRSKNFLIKNNKSYFFLKNYYLSLEEVLQIHMVGKFFYSGGIPVILPLLNKKGDSISIFNNQIYTLFPFVDGIVINKEELNEDNLFNLAQMLAKIHQRGRNIPNSFINAKAVNWNTKESSKEINELQRMIKPIKNKNDYDHLALNFLNLKKKILEDNKLQYEDFHLRNDHLIHGDYYEKNIFFNKEGKINAVFDWEKTKISPRSLEVIRSLEIICFSGIYNEITINKARTFLTSYNSIYPIQKEELIKALKAFVLIRAHSNRIERLHYKDQVFISDPLLINDFRFLEYNYHQSEDLINALFEK